MFVVVVNSANGLVPLRGTIWALDMDRAQKFETEELAKAALLKAKKFMTAATFKAAKIIKVEA